VQAGAGIVADSNPQSEQQECVNKARALFRAARKHGGLPARRSGGSDYISVLASRRKTMTHDHSHDHDHDHRWKHDGVRVIPGNSLDPNTAQTPGMDRKAAINFARVGAQKIWAGTVSIHANAKTGAHHHGPLESVIYVLKGKARMRWGEKLEYVAEAGPGDFIYVPPFVPHQEINASTDETLECVLVRSDNEAVVVNLDIEPAEKPENVAWVDPIHKG
jgi:uncharacterized RmlC-like cupin family protein